MRSLTRASAGVAAVVIAGTALAALAPGAARAARSIQVPCRISALTAAISTGNSQGSALIQLPGNCTYSITAPAAAGDGLPVITGSITIAGGAHTTIRRSPAAAAAFRVFEVATSGRLTLDSVTVANGSTAGLGGGVLNAGTVVLSRDTFTGNRASSGGGLASNAGATVRLSSTLFAGNTTTGVGGGAVLNSGTLTGTGLILTGNTAPINGGGVNTQPGGTTTIARSQITRNTSGQVGGGLSNLGTTTLTGTTVTRNTGSAGGGIATGNSNVTLRGSRVVRNNPDNCNPPNTIPGCVN